VIILLFFIVLAQCAFVQIFDGKTLDGWTQYPANQWTVNTTDTSMASLGLGRGFISYDKNLTSYRLRYTLRHNSGAPDHPSCVLFFGTTTSLDAMGAVQMMLPAGYGWDYRPGHNNNGGKLFTYDTHPKYIENQWAEVELVVYGNNGSAIATVSQPVGSTPVTVISFYDPTLSNTAGLFGWQMHNKGLFDEYKDVFLEVIE